MLTMSKHERPRPREVHHRQGETFVFFNPGTGQLVTFRQNPKEIGRSNRSQLLQELSQRPDEWKKMTRNDFTALQRLGYVPARVSDVLAEMRGVDEFDIPDTLE